MKQLWLNIIKFIDKLKQTQEIKLILLGLLFIIYVFYSIFKDNYSELKQRIRDLEKDKVELMKSKDTMRILMQDKLDQCKDEKLKNLEQMLIVSEKFKKISKIK